MRASRGGPTTILTGLCGDAAGDGHVGVPGGAPVDVLAAPVPRLPQERPLARRGASLAASLVIHGAVGTVLATLVSAAGARTPMALAQPVRPQDVPRIVFLLERGPGGGGGGGGRRHPALPSRAQTPGRDRLTLPAVRPPVSASEVKDRPLPAQSVLVDAMPLASGSIAQIGLPLASASEADSQGPGSEGGAGDGAGTGSGSGLGPGFGPGAGGGMGGGVYRPGSGVTVPVLLTVVKPVYTPDALRQRIEGAVQLEVVVRRDGTVGAVRVVRSLDPGGLDEQAIAAVRQWRFSPGRLGDVPVDVLVTAVVGFSIR